MVETNAIDVGRSSPLGDVTAAVVEGMASVSGCGPIEVDICLGEHVDPDALDALFASASDRDTSLELSATIEDYRVLIDSNGYVSVSELNAAGEAESAMVEI